MAGQVRERVMVADDDEPMRTLVSLALGAAGFDCVAVADGLRAVHALQSERYDAVVTDINMPDMRGSDLLRWVRISHPSLPVIIISGLEEVEVVRTTMKEGAFDFLVKPFDVTELVTTVKRAVEQGKEARASREHQRDLERLVEKRTAELERALEEIGRTYDATILALGSALETRDTETQTHGLRVARYSLLLARRLGIADRKRLTDIERGAYLHDIGKIGVPDHILRKKGPLTEEERAVMMRHPEIGMRLVASIGFLQGAAPIVYCHHERPDGSGYPRGLEAEEIPIEARVFSVADALDAMISERPYRGALPLEEARALLDRGAGSQFDPVVIQAVSDLADGDILAIAGLADREEGSAGWQRTAS